MSSNPTFAAWQALVGAKGVPETVQAGLQRQADQFWQVQIQTLDAMQALATGWFNRRREGAEAARAAAAAMCACDDPLEALRACQNWATGSMERIAADALALQSQAAALLPALAGSINAAIAIPAASAGTKPEPAHARQRSEAA